MTAIEVHRSKHLELAEHHLRTAEQGLIAAADYLGFAALESEDPAYTELKHIATRLRTEANNVGAVRASGLGAAS